MLKAHQEITEKYHKLHQQVETQLAAYEKRINMFSWVRVALLFVEALFFVFFVSSTSMNAQLLGGLGIIGVVIVFIVVVRKQEKAKTEQTVLRNLSWVYENEITTINSANNEYDNGSQFEDESHPYLADLDIFGSHSLFNLINRCATKRGIDNLAVSFTKPFESAVIEKRQEAVKELTEHIADTYGFRANLKGTDVNKIEEIKYKLGGDLGKQLSFTKSAILRFYVKLLPFLTPILLLAGLVFGDRLWGLFTLLLLVNATISFYLLKKVNLVYFGFTGSANMLNNYAKAIKWTEERNWQSIYIKKLLAPNEKVSEQIKALSSIIQAFDARLNILVGAFLNFTLLWDIKCSIKLDQWYIKSASKINRGLDSIGDFEELISLATFKHNNPSVTFPVIKNEFSLSAKNIGHPLIKLEKRIVNDFAFKNAPNVNIITGSNMAGKSTFLRTLGINMVLAYAGAPVSSSQMELSIFAINTYMRIKDSINESTSTFKAELNRLKMILSNAAHQPNPLVLIDEMLRGTNSHDKYLGSKVFIEKMMALNVPTLFATHDLHLADMEKDAPEKVANYHFDIQITQGEMNFDYKLKNGPCKIFNAAILLKEIGLSLS